MTMSTEQGFEPPPGPEEESVCRVCGYDEELFWEHGWPTNAICPCCGNESDIKDLSLMGIRDYRGEWIGHGAKWNSPPDKPKDWDLLKQIANIPPEWR
jgi:hypothetical protein